MDNYNKYLPSKKFVAIVLFFVLILGLFLGIRQIVSYFKNRKSLNGEKVITMTVGSIIQKDSNNNGIADWEEYLWGLDPNKNGKENRGFILDKKKSLIQSGVITPTDDSKLISESEVLSREFFAAVVSLQQTGELNSETMQSISESLGENIIPSPIDDVYMSTILTLVNDSDQANNTYYEAIRNLVNKYAEADIGSELTFVIQGLSDRDPQALYAAKTVGDAYMSFGEEFVKIPTPRSLATIHLSVANNYEKTGQSIIGLTKILAEPIIGMRSIINYKKYNDLLATDLEKLSDFLQ